ncbi:MAG: cysteine--tRNA ligase [Deltaproteobacteria bacterium]
MKLYNTLTKQKEEFKPLKGNQVRIYSCGPTVYMFAHIGNLRAYIFADTLRRMLQYNRYDLKHVMNITDVGHLRSDADEGEDKMLKTAREQKKTPWEIAEYYTGIFMRDCARLNIQKPEVVCKATEHIPEMIEFVEGLVEKGYAYEIGDGIYFDISKFKEYGKLSGAAIEEQLAGARVEVNDEKKNPADFALWKKAPKEHIMQWASPWGQGYPGWHIECSAMSKKYLDEQFDIHTGGIDHIPIHHENEIAQSQGLTGKNPAIFWMHNEFILVDGGKMSKSLGNIYTIDDLEEKGFEPVAYRLFSYNAHYRNKLNFTWEGLQGAQNSLDKIREGVLAHKNGIEKISQQELENLRHEFKEAINDDLNIPKAMTVVWEIIKDSRKSADFAKLLMDFDRVLALELDKVVEKKGEEIPAEVQELVEQRQNARENKEWKLSDELRDRIKEMGYVIEDTAQGAKVKKI